MEIRPLKPADRGSLSSLLQRIPQFTPDEVVVALELIDLAAQPGGHPDYVALVAEEAGRVVGYVLYGPTPMTLGTWDLYWIATDPETRALGAGTALSQAMERDLVARNARLVRVETSAQEAYGATRKFYERNRYLEAARITDFYKPGDHLVMLVKRFDA